MENAIIDAGNLVWLNNRLVGRVHAADQVGPRDSKPTVRFYTRGDAPRGFSVEHVIDAPAYVGAVDRWSINPAFSAAVAAIVGGTK
jgi:hypothetical protein